MVKSDSFKVQGFRVGRDYAGGNFYIFFKRGQKRSLKTKDRRVAKEIAKVTVAKYFERKINLLKKGNRRRISEYFVDYKKNRSDLSISTLRMDDTAIKMFIDVVGDKIIDEINTNDIERFKRVQCQRRMDHRKGKISKISINSYLRHLKAFFNQAKRDGLADNVLEFKKLKTPQKLPKILTQDEKKRLLEYCFKNDFELWRIIQFALFTGCRRSEILSARWENVSGDIITVFGKGSKERIVPLVKKAQVAMGPRKSIGFIFFQTHPDTYTHRFKKNARKCGIFDKSFHNLRHSAATTMLEAGIDINVIQKILGHEVSTTTLIYTKVRNNLIIQEMRKLENL